MIKHTLNVLRSEHRKILKVHLGIFQHYEWKVDDVTKENEAVLQNSYMWIADISENKKNYKIAKRSERILIQIYLYQKFSKDS